MYLAPLCCIYTTPIWKELAFCCLQTMHIAFLTSKATLDTHTHHTVRMCHRIGCACHRLKSIPAVSKHMLSLTHNSDSWENLFLDAGILRDEDRYV